MTLPKSFRNWVLGIGALNLLCVVLWYATGFYIAGGEWLLIGVLVLSAAQFIIGIVALFSAPSRVAGVVASLTAPLIAFMGVLPLAGAGWGRPLRIRGRQLHPNLREGSDWTLGERPHASHLDAATRSALAALWLHDAQKEHASVPAFSRVSWLLAAVGAPADLVTWAHRAALEEIEHAQKCFALAAGYGGRSYTVEPMPGLLLGGLDCNADPLETLAVESLDDGCQLEDFNADVAGECSRICEDPVTRAVLEQIGREERSHAEFSWALLEWLLERHPASVRGAVENALSRLDAIKRPTAVSWDKLRLVAAADEWQLRRHGRIRDERWSELWQLRLSETRRRLGDLLARRAIPVQQRTGAASA